MGALALPAIRVARAPSRSLSFTCMKAFRPYSMGSFLFDAMAASSTLKACSGLCLRNQKDASIPLATQWRTHAFSSSGWALSKSFCMKCREPIWPSI